MHDEHKVIAKYVIEQDADRAEEAARYHIRQLIDRLSSQQAAPFDSLLKGGASLLAAQRKEEY